MLFGYDNLVSDFKKIVDKRQLSHAYLFFGEPQVGKFLFAQSLANYIENQKFEKPLVILRETLIIDFSKKNEEKEAGQESLGIEAVREVSRFLYQTSISAPYRVVIIRDAQWLTQEAQNALLKILEEPPLRGVIILTASDKTAFLSTVSSRVLAVFFKTLPDSAILDFLVKYGTIKPDNAKEIVSQSFGRIGRALEIIEGTKDRLAVEQIVNTAISAKDSYSLEASIDSLLKLAEKNINTLYWFYETIIIYLRKKVVHNSSALLVINQEIQNLESISANKRIHIKNILWTTKSILSV